MEFCAGGAEDARDGFVAATGDVEGSGDEDPAVVFLGGMGRIASAPGAVFCAGDPVATLVGFCADTADGVMVTVSSGVATVFVFVTTGLLGLVGRTTFEPPSGIWTVGWLVAGASLVSVTVTAGGVFVTVTVTKPFPPASGFDPRPPETVGLGAGGEEA